MSTTVRIAVERAGKVQPREERAALYVEGGLAVTRDCNAPTYAVTHIASGYAVIKVVRTRAKARQALQRFLAAGDWTRARTHIERDRELRSNALAIRGELLREGIIVR